MLVVVLAAGVRAVDSARPPDRRTGPTSMFVLSLAVPPSSSAASCAASTSRAAFWSPQQEVIRDQAVQGERDRIARELHDVIAHSISAMVVQTAAAQDLMHDPAGAGQADAGRSHRRPAGRPWPRPVGCCIWSATRPVSSGLRPAPSVTDLPALVQSFRERRRWSSTRGWSSPTTPLPGGIDVSAYRVVQEALTNAMRHAEGPVRLQLTTTPDQRAHPPAPTAVGATNGGGSGLGLRGMAERVELLGGSMDSTRTPGGRLRCSRSPCHCPEPAT